MAKYKKVLDGRAGEMAQRIAAWTLSQRKLVAMTQAQFAAHIGIGNAAQVYKLEACAMNYFSLDVLERMIAYAHRRGYTCEELFTGKTLSEMIDEEDAGAALARRFVEAGFEQIAVSRQIPPRSPSRGYETLPASAAGGLWPRAAVPVMSRVASGVDIAARSEEAPPAWCGEILHYLAAKQSLIAVRVVGQSMRPTYADGDMVVADTTRPVSSGIAVIVLTINDELAATVKHLVPAGDTAILISYDQAVSPRHIAASDVRAAYGIIDHLSLQTKGTP
jgi:SOS-response transcriptional repressor LexA